MKSYKIIEPKPYDDSHPDHLAHVMDSPKGLDWKDAKAAVLEAMKKQIEWAEGEVSLRQQHYDEVTALTSEKAFRKYFEPAMVAKGYGYSPA